MTSGNIIELLISNDTINSITVTIRVTKINQFIQPGRVDHQQDYYMTHESFMPANIYITSMNDKW